MFEMTEQALNESTTLKVYGLSPKTVDSVCLSILSVISGYSTKGPICHESIVSDLFKLGKATKTYVRSIEISDIDRDCVSLIEELPLPSLVAFDIIGADNAGK